MNLDVYGNIADIVAIPIAIIGVLVVAQQLYLSRKEEQSEHLKKQKEVTLHAYNLVREDLSQRLGKVRKELELNDMYSAFTEKNLKEVYADEKLRVQLSIVLGIYERFSIGVHHGVYNQELIYDLSGTNFIQVFKQFKPYIHKVREKQSSFVEGLEYLVLKLEDTDKSKKAKGLKKFDIANKC